MTPVVVIGGGGHAKVVIDAARAAKLQVLGFLAKDLAPDSTLLGATCLGDDDAFFARFAPGDVFVAHGVGMVRTSGVRREIFERYKRRGYTFVSVVHPRSVVAEEVAIGEGTVVMAGAILQPGVTLHENVIVNTSASVDHDCVIGAHTHVAPGATISGGVSIGAGSFIGAGAVVRQGSRIGANCLVGAGAVVVRDVGDGEEVVGIPARQK